MPETGYAFNLMRGGQSAPAKAGMESPYRAAQQMEQLQMQREKFQMQKQQMQLAEQNTRQQMRQSQRDNFVDHASKLQYDTEITDGYMNLFSAYDQFDNEMWAKGIDINSPDPQNPEALKASRMAMQMRNELMRMGGELRQGHDVEQYMAKEGLKADIVETEALNLYREMDASTRPTQRWADVTSYLKNTKALRDDVKGIVTATQKELEGIYTTGGVEQAKVYQESVLAFIDSRMEGAEPHEIPFWEQAKAQIENMVIERRPSGGSGRPTAWQARQQEDQELNRYYAEQRFLIEAQAKSGMPGVVDSPLLVDPKYKGIDVGEIRINESGNVQLQLVGGGFLDYKNVGANPATGVITLPLEEFLRDIVDVNILRQQTGIARRGETSRAVQEELRKIRDQNPLEQAPRPEQPSNNIPRVPFPGEVNIPGITIE